MVRLEQNKDRVENKDSGFEKVAPTAWMVAYRRTFSDIPFSREIFRKLEDIIKKSGQSEIPSDLKKPELAPQFEARHKLIDKMIRQAGTNQILELAAGFSSRGLSMARDDGFNYVELDLPSVIIEKEQVIREIASEAGFAIPDNLYFEPGNVLELENLKKAAKHFNEAKPVTIVNEGLLRYLNFQEKAQVAENIHSLLKEFGGTWITSDVSLRKIFNQENKVIKDHVQKISELTGKNIEGNRFETEAEARKFFEDLGFSISRHSFREVIADLSSPARLGLSQAQVDDLLADAVVFVMKAV